MRNPGASEHADQVFALLRSAEEELDLSRGAFEAHQMDAGWNHYLEAFRELGRAQQEILHASEIDDPEDLDMLDRANTRINELDAVIRRGLNLRLGTDVPLDRMFELAPPTAILTRLDLLQVPIGDWKRMRSQIAHEMVRRYGSIRKASPVLGVPRTTLAAWLKEPPLHPMPGAA